MLNIVTLIGRLTRDPESRTVGDGVTVTRFTLAVDRPFANQQGERETDFIDVVAWRQLGETVGRLGRKGRLVAVQGRLQTRNYEGRDGSPRRATEVVADTVRFLDPPRAAAPDAGWPAPDEPEGSAEGEDVPF